MRQTKESSDLEHFPNRFKTISLCLRSKSKCRLMNMIIQGHILAEAPRHITISEWLLIRNRLKRAQHLNWVALVRAPPSVGYRQLQLKEALFLLRSS